MLFVCLCICLHCFTFPLQNTTQNRSARRTHVTYDTRTTCQALDSHGQINKGPDALKKVFVYFAKKSVTSSLRQVLPVIFRCTKFCQGLPNFKDAIVLTRSRRIFVSRKIWQIRTSLCCMTKNNKRLCLGFPATMVTGRIISHFTKEYREKLKCFQ